MYMMYQIILKNEYSGKMQSFTRLYPQETSTILITRLQPFDYPQGHWYRDQMTNINTQTC